MMKNGNTTSRTTLRCHTSCGRGRVPIQLSGAWGVMTEATQKTGDDAVHLLNLEDLARRIADLETRASRQEGEMKGLRGRIEELERR